MQKTITFVAGVHGVGKTTFCKELALIKKTNHYSSSELIRLYNSKLEFVDKKITDVQGNQDALINSIKENIEDTNFILDGHFTLFNKFNEVIKVPIDTFQKLNPQKIILMTLDPMKLITRLNKRKENQLTMEQIKLLQQNEIQQAQKISTLLNIKLIKLSSIDTMNSYLLNKGAKK